MTVKLHTISLGFVNCYLIQGEKNILIDAGAPGMLKSFLKKLTQTGIQPADIDLILFTHGHFDHIGFASELKELSGATAAIHQREVEWLETGKPVPPPGVTPWGKALISLIKLTSGVTLPPTQVDIPLSDNDFSLAEYGIPGRVIYTPGHSMGSVSILLDSGEAIVGDLAMNYWLMGLTPGLPIFAEDIEMVKDSWRKLLKEDIRVIYPGHGKPFPPDVIRKILS